MPIVRPRSSLIEALGNQRSAIARSCASFDDGHLWEAGRLAASVFVIVHDASKRDQSLLTRIGVRGSTRFLCSNRKTNPRNLASEHLLASVITTNNGARFIPRLDSLPECHRWLQFHEWWEKDVIIRIGSQSLTRKRLVFNLRNKEGGAHFDTRIEDPSYVAVLNEPIWRFQVGERSVEPLLGVELVSMRQIAWELDRSLDNLGEIV